MKISEASEQSGISSDTLRYYERIGLLPSVNRNKSGIREYSELDLRRVEFVKCMRSVGLPIEVLIEYYRLVQQGGQTIGARKEILIEQRAQLVAKMADIQKTQYRITCFLAHWESAGTDPISGLNGMWKLIQPVFGGRAWQFLVIPQWQTNMK